MDENIPSGSGERSLASILAEIRDEIKSFLETRVELFKADLQESVATLKAGLPLAAVAAVLMGTAYLLSTLSLVALIVVAFGENPYRWFLSLLIVGVIWLIAGAIAAYSALHRFRARGMFPKKTVEVLRADKNWLQHEVKGTL